MGQRGGSSMRLGDVISNDGTPQVFAYDAYGVPIGFTLANALTALLYNGEQSDRLTAWDISAPDTTTLPPAPSIGSIRSSETSTIPSRCTTITVGGDLIGKSLLERRASRLCPVLESVGHADELRLGLTLSALATAPARPRSRSAQSAPRRCGRHGRTRMDQPAGRRGSRQNRGADEKFLPRGPRRTG